jgi:arsenate reductase
MACAFAQHLAGENIEPLGAGHTPAKEADPSMVAVMKENGIDMAFRIPQLLDMATLKKQPDLVIFMDRETETAAAVFPESKRQVWDLPDPSGKALDYFRDVRDDIEEKVKEMIARIS